MSTDVYESEGRINSPCAHPSFHGSKNEFPTKRKIVPLFHILSMFLATIAFRTTLANGKVSCEMC